MKDVRTITIEFRLTREKALFILSFLFLVWHPGALGSETLTLTTYYPAPYGGYAALLTTGGTPANPLDTLLARDAGQVGIGTSDPEAELDINGDILIRGGNPQTGKFLTATDTIGHTTWADIPGGCQWQTFSYGASTDCSSPGYVGYWTVMAVRLTADWMPECLLNVTTASCASGAKELLTIDQTNSGNGVVSYLALPAGTLLPLTAGRLMPTGGEMLCCETDMI